MPRRVSVPTPTLRGDLHVHSTHTSCDHEAGMLYGRGSRCGRQAITEMVKLAQSSGVEYFALVNHASDPARPHHADRYVNEKILHHLHEIIRFNAQRKPKSAAILAGVESSILDYGELDVDNNILSHLDIVIVSRHAGTRQLSSRTMANFLKVMENPHVDILGHPSRYLHLTESQWERVIQQAVDTATAIEFNLRLGFDERMARLAAENNVMVALGSDIHREQHQSKILVSPKVGKAKTLLKQLLNAGISPQQILNLKPLPVLMAWLERRE